MNKLKHANGNHPLTEQEKLKMIEQAAKHYGDYMTALGFDWSEDPNSSETPIRVAKAFVNDLASGVYSESPKITAFDNVDEYDLCTPIYIFYSFPIISIPPSFFFFFLLFTLRYSLSGKKSYHLQKLRLHTCF